MHDKLKGRRLFFISGLFILLLNFPLLSIFNKGGYVGGVPVLYGYLMVVWLLCIGAVAFLMERQQKNKPN